MKTTAGILALPSYLQFPNQGPGHGYYRGQSGICHDKNQYESGWEAGTVGLDNTPVLGRGGTKGSTSWTYCSCVQSIMRPLQQAEISFMPHVILGYAPSTHSRSTLVKTDISCADISSLPSSVCSAGDMPQLDNQLWLSAYKSALKEMTLDSMSSTGVVKPNVKMVQKNPEREAGGDDADKSTETWSSLLMGM